MHPVLFQIGPFTLHTYGVFVAAAFFLAIGLSLKEARRQGLDPERMLDLAFYVTLGAILGARLLFIIVEYPYFLEDPIRIFKIWEGGLVFYGGLIFAFVLGAIYAKRHHMPIPKVADIVAPALAIAQSVGRMGCLSAGCCYGKETTLPWGIVFDDPNSLVPLEKLGLHLHPTQIYSSLSSLLLFVILYVLLRKKRFDGQVFLMYGMLYPLFRSLNEFLRGDPRGSLFAGSISTAQFISAGVFLLSFFFYLKFNRKAASKP